jgi:hypothetical protein
MTDDATTQALKDRIAALEDALAPFALALYHMGDVAHDRAFAESIRKTLVGPGITLDDLLLARDVMRRAE